MAKELNATCRICGRGYHRCDSCNEKNGNGHYKRFVDSPNCFKIYAAITGVLPDSEKKTRLEKCDTNTLLPDVKVEVERIMGIEPKKKKLKNEELSVKTE